MSSSGSMLFLAKITVSVTVRILLTFCVVRAGSTLPDDDIVMSKHVGVF